MLQIKTKENYVNFMVLNKLKFSQFDDVVEINLKVFLANDVKCHGCRHLAQRSMEVEEFMKKYMQINKFSRPGYTYLAMHIDRETSYIKKVFDDELTLDQVIGPAGSLSFINLPRLLRIQQVPEDSEVFALV